MKRRIKREYAIFFVVVIAVVSALLGWTLKPADVVYVEKECVVTEFVEKECEHIEESVEKEIIEDVVEEETKENVKTEPQTIYDYISDELIEMEVVATAYCPCYECSEGYGAMTSTGVMAKEGRTIAVDPTVIPYGSEIYIDGKRFFAEDCGALIKGKKIDIYFENHEKTEEFGKQNITIQICKGE